MRSNLYNSEVWISLVLSKSKKESKYSKVDSGERAIRDLAANPNMTVMYKK